MTEPAGLELRAGDQTPVIVHGARAHTRAQLRAESERLVALLQGHGLTRAMVCSDDPLHILRAIDACSRAGVDLYVAHTNLPAATLDEIATTFGIQLRIGDNDELTGRGGTPDAHSAAARIFMMTSGTTGRPKIATHTLESLLSRVRAGAQFAANRGGRWLLTYQPTGFAGVQVMLTAVSTQGVVVSVPQRSPAAFYEAAKANAVSQISATPTFWRSFLMLASPGDVPLRQITLGGEAADQATLDRLRKVYPQARITHTYASTEAGVVYAVHDGREGFPAAWLEQPTQAVQLRIRDGLLQIKTANAMRGYVTESAQPLLEDGWLATADRCETRGDRVFVLGREDSTINVGGSKVYPLAVETFLLAQPGVVEAKVYGIPNPISGFLVAADVVLAAGCDPQATRAAVLAACREGLAGYQLPRILKVVETIKVGASGKKG